jgi:hypothetical protein
MAKVFLVFLTLVLGGCALPNTAVRANAERPTLAVQGAPDAAVLYVDGLSMGLARQFDGGQRLLLIEEGAHQVEVRVDGHPIYSERILASTGETKIVYVGGGSK